MFKKKCLWIWGLLVLNGCALSEWIVGNAEAIEQGGEVATAAGPYGALVALGTTTVVGFAKWWEHKATATEVIKATQKAKDELPDASKKILSNAYNTHMPSKVKKYVAKVKKRI